MTLFNVAMCLIAAATLAAGYMLGGESDLLSKTALLAMFTFSSGLMGSDAIRQFRSVLSRRKTEKRPPGVSRFILWLFAKPRLRDAIVDDLNEIYEINVAKHGIRWARMLYRWDVFRSVFVAVVGLLTKAAVLRKIFYG